MSNRLVEHRDPVALERARELLAGDGVVAFPTETVYGLAINAASERARERLYALKGRDAKKPMARYVVSPNQMDAYVPRLPRTARRLAEAMWPGPLTLVLDGPETTEGFRCSSHPFVAALAMSSDPPFIGTSANPSGTPPLRRARDIDRVLGDGVDLIVADDQAISHRASTVLRIHPDDRRELMREGEIGLEMIDRELRPRILFVCTGNTCRSPMAVALWRRAEEADDVDLSDLFSAGLAAYEGQPASEGARAAMERRGRTLAHHRACPVTADLLTRMDRIYALTAAHRDALLSAAPEVEDRLTLLDPAGDDVIDPFGGSDEDYEACAQHLEDLIANRRGEPSG